MTRGRAVLCGVLAIAVAAGLVAPAGATTLVRAGLDTLVAGNEAVVVGEVLNTRSYWNDEGTFILTDVLVSAVEVVKGEIESKELTVTLMGGTVGDLSTLIVGGARLVPGKAYVLFLDQEDLPGVQDVLTVREHCQGVFDLVMTKNGLRAISQANELSLVPDAHGAVDAPGGREGLPFKTMLESMREITARPRFDSREVTQ